MTENNKDYVINLRVSRKTYDKIKTKAVENRDTVSNLLRKVIEDSGEIMKDLGSDMFGNKKKDFSDIVGYHEITLARDLDCDKCGQTLKKDMKAAVGEAAAGKRYYFCNACE